MKLKQLFIIASVVTMPAYAQQKWDLKQCIDHAIANNLTIKLQEAQREQSKVEHSQKQLPTRLERKRIALIQFRPESSGRQYLSEPQHPKYGTEPEYQHSTVQRTSENKQRSTLETESASGNGRPEQSQRRYQHTGSFGLPASAFQ